MLMSKAAYAKYCSVSRQTVYDWIAKGDVVMSGSKIDVEATERQRKGGDESGPEITTTDPQESRTLEMTWEEFWKAVQAGDNKTPPATNEEIQQCVRLAAGELNWSVEFLEDEGIYLDDGDAEHYVVRYDLKTNAGVAIGLIRQELRYSASLCPDDMAEWSQEGLNALAEWA
ncbi:hypothetical protein [Serratia oryzae]|uniref:Uncharacterized protein n=1 Tax=Serratia oryzae TaxID=2034155 RepID=A0A1S8CJ94_9GAMM|nr:hypothetical protein [Serratia oryzae]OMQ22179.1 hypothetical protein BMI79_11700 [Serratia oryzae]